MDLDKTKSELLQEAFELENIFGAILKKLNNKNVGAWSIARDETNIYIVNDDNLIKVYDLKLRPTKNIKTKEKEAEKTLPKDY